MWELIRANKRNSIVLMVLMAVVLLLLGFVIGLAFFGAEGGFLGLMIATVIWIVLTLISFSSGAGQSRLPMRCILSCSMSLRK